MEHIKIPDKEKLMSLRFPVQLNQEILFRKNIIYRFVWYISKLSKNGDLLIYCIV